MTRVQDPFTGKQEPTYMTIIGPYSLVMKTHFYVLPKHNLSVRGKYEDLKTESEVIDNGEYI